MERYYKMLGVSSNATKEEIKEAYLKKIKAIHPDKVNGTPLEDTATFLSVEINEAYNVLMKKFNNGQVSKTKMKNIYVEEDIYIESIGVLRYSLSNDFGKIKNAVIKSSGIDDLSFINKYGWQLNHELSENVKKAMIKHNVNYSMTCYVEGHWLILIINKRDGDNWLITGYEQELITTSENQYRNKLFNDDVLPGNYGKEKANSFCSVFVWAMLVGLSLLFVGIGYKNEQQWNENLEVKQAGTISAPAAVARTQQQSVTEMIDSTLWLVAKDLRKKVDVNKDGLINCIDAAVLFYQHFPNKDLVTITINVNRKTGMNHLFNMVNINGTWRGIEPQAYWKGQQSYYMVDVWSREYDHTFNINETNHWKRYVR